ncbi:MAG TPA: TIGR03364 family FAD-dependent oxidoreductase [Urbifossiella sp.]|jgi:FAD dependent oxidoreductase TIGR03364|nr:TIGR03364 family FAD-dependent oxidoreductase [Urbifossiella sp.]
MTGDYDVAVAGAGVLGLAHAYHLARRGLKVIVFERHPQARGASVRNFGMLWPIGQPAGDRYRLARRSRDIWRDVLRAADLWSDPCGSLHLAYHPDEEQVLREFAADAATHDRPCEVLPAAAVARRFPAVRAEGLRAGLWSPTEACVDPRQVIAELPGHLARTFGVTFAFGTTVLGHDGPRLATTAGEFIARRLVICTGEDFRDLVPAAFAASGQVRCKLQMMRSQPYGDRLRLGTMLAAALTLRHYPSFAKCPTLPALAARLDAELPEYGRYGIHVMASQNAAGEVVIGDSHEYGDAVSPFDNPHVDGLILDYLRRFLALPDLAIAARWHGVYIKHPTAPWVVARPAPHVLAVTSVGGAGMTLSFGLAEQLVADFLGESL